MFRIGFVLFPNLTQLDFTGPLQVLHRLPESETLIVAESLEPVPSDCGLALVPTSTFATCPPLDLICVPGGFGVGEAMANPALTGFVRAQAETARYITSVCTGAFILGAAGLLADRKATTHWAYHGLLARFGAIPAKGRIVWDGSLATGGGVTAGIDFALDVAAAVAGREVAEAIQLSLEYNPAPPFAAGHPEFAPAALRERVEGFYAPRLATFAAQIDALRP